MTAIRMDGRLLARQWLGRMAAEAGGLRREGIVPGLAVVGGEDPAARQYVLRMERAAASIGICVRACPLPAAADEDDILGLLDELNRDDDVHGILVQQPLGAHIDARSVLSAIDPQKDVDGASPASQGLLTLGLPSYIPATAYAVAVLLEQYGVAVAGREAVVVGRSPVVGRPVAALLLQRDATVTVCHRRTEDLAAHTRRADVLVVAAGQAGLVRGDMIKPGAAVIDVGTNVTDSGTVGDVVFEEASRVAGWVTPVPGGVGPLTTAAILQNTIRSARRRARQLAR
ncbi:MAG: bifunctional 5,10-methylenetetrahydrofolate dehydrogenase/5,10-methenyltetrahydrofolate cyclohydrolase [Firmicutes bacterium]|nr:bifunctional 5,10-methylenetetrahydrofolate dehydrogenase/5,10-methenyltetrahydrofolate cyclohydrolase [Bacillota bacterium]